MRTCALPLLVILTALPSAATAQGPAAPTNVSVADTSPTPLQGKQWTISDDGHFVTAENAVLRLKFGYNAANYQGWFQGTTSGGGGRDGGIVELYYKPTSPTRNLIFRNGTYGSGYDNMDFWEAEAQGGTQANFNAPDYESGRHAIMNSHTVSESAGRLIATFDFQFQAWHIIRTYTVYPWGDITVSAQLTVTQTANWNYLAHRFSFGVSPYTFTNGSTYDWGGNYRNDGEFFHAWSDGAPGGTVGENFYEYSKPISTSTNENSVIYDFGRSDQYSGLLIDDANGNDPDIVVMAGDRDIYASPFQQVSRRVSTAGGVGAYIETALFNISWAPSNESVAQMTYFYMTTPSGQFGVQSTWPTSLGTWREIFHVMFRRNMKSADYLPLWKSRARDLQNGAPTLVSGAGAPQVNASDNLYHLSASSGASTVRFQWTRPAAAVNAIDYRTAFVVEQFDPTWVQIQGVGAPALDAYYDPATHSTLLVLSGAQSATPQAYTISLGK